MKYGPGAMINYVKDIYIPKLYPSKEEIFKDVRLSLRDAMTSIVTMCYSYHEMVSDLALFCSIRVRLEDYGTEVIPLRTQYIEYLGMTTKEVKDAAEINTRENFLMPKLSVFAGPIDVSGMYIVSSETMIDGAAEVLCYDKVFKKIDCPENGVIMIPTSVHEFVVFENNGKYTINEAKELIYDVDRNCRFIKDDYLSDKTYFMDKNGNISIMKEA
jgi:hypothetical protein